MESEKTQSEKSLIEEARKFLNSKQYEDAIVVIGRAIKLHPNSILIFHLGATTSLAKGDAEGCRRYGECIQAIDPNNPLGYHAIANSYLSTEKPYDYREHQSCQNALNIAYSGLNKNPGHPGLMLTLVRAQMALGLFQDALNMSEHALTVNPQLDGAVLYAAQSALAVGNYDKSSQYAAQLKGHIVLSKIANEVTEQIRINQLADTLIASCLNTIDNVTECATLPYEHAVSLGSDCLPAALIAKHGRRSAAMPFDWLVCPANTLLELFKCNFDDFLDPDLLAADPSSMSSYHRKYKELRFPHHNLTIPEVRSAFTRRVERFRESLTSDCRVLFLISQAELAVVREISEYLPASSLCLSLWLQDCTWMQTPCLSIVEKTLHIDVPAFTCESSLPSSWPTPTNHKTKSGGDIQCKYARKMVDLVLQNLLQKRNSE